MRQSFFLIVLLAALVVTLIIGQAFGFVWAGGNGYFPNEPILINTMDGSVNIDHLGETRTGELEGSIERGEIVSTEAGDRVELTVQETKIYLDERSTVEIIHTNTNILDLLVTRGRVFVDATEGNQEITLRSHELDASFYQGQASLVNYDFRRTVSLIAFVTPVIYETKNGDLGLITETGIDYLEVEPYTINDFEFDYTTSSASEFYLWVAKLTDIIN